MICNTKWSAGVAQLKFCNFTGDFCGSHWWQITVDECVCYGRSIGQAIIFCSSGFFSLSFFVFFSLAYSQRLQIGCLPYYHTWCGLSANLECRSVMCCTGLTENTGRKNSPSGHHRTTLLGYIFATKACIDNWKKLVKQQYLLHMSSQYGELRPTNGWDQLASLGHPYSEFRVWASLFSRFDQQHSTEGAITLGISPQSTCMLRSKLNYSVQYTCFISMVLHHCLTEPVSHGFRLLCSCCQ